MLDARQELLDAYPEPGRSVFTWPHHFLERISVELTVAMAVVAVAFVAPAGPLEPHSRLPRRSTRGRLAAYVPSCCLLAPLSLAPVARRRRVVRHFFNLFGPEEVLDPRDPGRVEVCKEYQARVGAAVAAEASDFGWATVSRHECSEQDGYWKGAAKSEVLQEWRELRLAKSSPEQPGSSEGTGQSVVKVSVLEGEVQQVPYCMALGYTKSLCAVALTGAHLQGAMVLEDLPQMRALVIGLGAGSIPLWLEHTFQQKMVVDALEIDPAVVKVATDDMGFPKSAVREAAAPQEAAKDAVSHKASLRVYLLPGADVLLLFVLLFLLLLLLFSLLSI